MRKFRCKWRNGQQVETTTYVCINMENFKIWGASKEEREAQHEQCFGIEKLKREAGARNGRQHGFWGLVVNIGMFLWG